MAYARRRPSITVPGLDGYVAADGSINVGDITQARFEGEIECSDFIAVTLDVPIEDIEVRRTDAKPGA
jgi:hypothetical protein